MIEPLLDRSQFRLAGGFRVPPHHRLDPGGRGLVHFHAEQILHKHQLSTSPPLPNQLGTIAAALSSATAICAPASVIAAATLPPLIMP
jgi:hypothetical protein